MQAADVAMIVGGGTPSTKDDSNFAEPGSGIPWIGPADLTGYSDIYIGKGRRDLTAKGLAASGATIMPAGTVLFSSRAPIGYCAIAANPVSTNQGFKSWVCAAEILPEFVRYYLRASIDYADSLASGTTFREVSGKRIAGMAFPLPPVAEQRRIVANLDALTARLARVRAELDRVPVLAAKLRRQTLGNAFQLDERGSIRLGDVVDDVRYGTAQKCGYALGATPVLRIPNVQRGRVDLGDIKSADFDLKEQAKLALQAGDVLVIRSNGSIDLVGRSAVVGAEAAGMLYAGYLIRLRLSPNRAFALFIHHFLQSPVARDLIAANARSTSGVNNVNAQQLQALPVPVRDLFEQEEIVRRIETAFARADHLEAEATRARALIDRLEAAILARAFRGELVPQDPADEPASVLLERIRAERAAAPKPKRGRRASAAAA